MKSLLLLATIFSASPAFAGELTCRVIKNESIYTGQYDVLATERGIAIRKGRKLVASGPAQDSGAAYELKVNNVMIEEGGEVFLSNDWSDAKGGQFTIIDRTRDLGNMKTEFECEAK